MSDLSDLLPRAQQPFETGLTKAFTDTLPVPIRTILKPDVTLDEFIPFLASHRSVDLWFEDWAEERKREMIAEAPELAKKVGTRYAVDRALYYVDGVVVDAISYPERFVMGRAVIGRTPINHPAFVARYLIKVETVTPPRAFVMGRAVIGRHVLKTPSREKFKRVLIALRFAKSPGTKYRVDFAHKRLLTLADMPELDDGHYLGEYIDRHKL